MYEEEFADHRRPKPASVVASLRRSLVRFWQREPKTADECVDRMIARQRATFKRITGKDLTHGD